MRWIFLVNLGRLFDRARELGISIIIFTFYRSPEDQVKEFHAGRSRTVSGYHPMWLAVDLALWEDLNSDGVVNKEEIRWKVDPRYVTLGQYWESLGGVWGGRWTDPYDPFHFQWSKDLKE